MVIIGCSSGNMTLVPESHKKTLLSKDLTEEHLVNFMSQVPPAPVSTEHVMTSCAPVLHP